MWGVGGIWCLLIQTTIVGIVSSTSNIWILDVDNCLYDEKKLRLKGSGIESQIITNTHEFGQRHFQLSPEECDALYHSYGSSVEGFRHLVRQKKDKEEDEEVSMLKQYYKDAYEPIDMSCLLYGDKSISTSGSSTTGYSHEEKQNKTRNLYQLLKALTTSQKKQIIYLASNSPSHHVRKVLVALGLTDIPFKGILTPDTVSSSNDIPFPTKSIPRLFYQSILDQKKKCILLDDSKFNIQTAKKECNIDGIQINHEETTLEVGLLQAMKCLDPDFTFSDSKYLQDKNRIDEQSINVAVWNQLGKQLARRMATTKNDVLMIVDVGAGLLSMLKLILNGSSSQQKCNKESLLSNLAKDKDHPIKVKELIYTAFEPNIQLLEGCRSTLKQLGFTENETTKEKSFEFSLRNKENVKVTVHLHFQDFQDSQNNDYATYPDLIVGCCFADLFGNPHDLVKSLYHHFTINCKGATANDDENNNIKKIEDVLVYFPITFTGTTQFFPPKPVSTATSNSDSGIIPSDTTAFQMYADALEKQLDHNLDPQKLIDAMEAYGGILLSNGPSKWMIDPTKNEYMWNAMMYFFGLSAAPTIIQKGYDATGWIQRARTTKPSIQVSNQDLLFSIPASLSYNVTSNSQTMLSDDNNSNNDSTTIVEEIEFQSPYKVGKTVKEWKTTSNETHLRSGEVESKSLS